MVVKLLKGISNTIQWGPRPRLTHYQLLKSKVSVERSYVTIITRLSENKNLL